MRDIDTENWVWTVCRQTTPSPGELQDGGASASGGGLVDKNTKGRRARQVPLIESIRDLVRRRIEVADGEPDARVFTGPRGGRITTTQRYLHPDRQSVADAGELLTPHLPSKPGRNLRVV